MDSNCARLYHRVYAAEVLGLERDFFMPLANTAVRVVCVLGARRMLVSLNGLCHLRTM